MFWWMNDKELYFQVSPNEFSSGVVWLEEAVCNATIKDKHFKLLFLLKNAAPVVLVFLYCVCFHKIEKK